MFAAYEQPHLFNEHTVPLLNREQHNDILRTTFSSLGLNKIEEELIIHQVT